MTRREFLGTLAAVTVAPSKFAQRRRLPIQVHALNHLSLSVTDMDRSLEFYQGLFGMPIAARQAGTIVLRVGNGPQSLALGGRNANASRMITHFGLSVRDFDADRLVHILSERGVEPADGVGPMRTQIRMRGVAFGGAPEGTPELYFGDPDGIIIQLQDVGYCGGHGVMGDVCDRIEPAPSPGLFTLEDLNHFTLFVSDQARSIAIYQLLFGMPINRYQGALPLLSVGSSGQFLALAQVPAKPTIHHACMTIKGFQHEEVMAKLEDFGITPRAGDARGPVLPLTSYVILRMENRGGAPSGTPELYFTDPDGILLQLQDVSYCGGAGYFGEKCG